MKGRELTGVTERELDRRQFLKAAGAATALGAAGVLGGDLLLGCAPAKAPKAEVPKAPAGYESIRIVGASLGSRSTTVVSVYATVFNKYYPEIEWSSSSGATATNAIYLTKGSIKMCTLLSGAYVTAYGFEKIAESRLRSINLPAALTHIFFLIPEDKPWKDITEVPKGASVCPGPAGGVTSILAETWLELCGLSKKDFNWLPLGKSEMADAWRAQKLDLFMMNPQVVTSALMDTWIGRRFKPMGLSPEQAARAKTEQTFERAGLEAPAKSTLTECVPELFKDDVLCVGSVNFLSCRDDFPADIAYRMAEIIDEHNAELVSIYVGLKDCTPQSHMQWAKPPLDIHSGVAKYYKDKGYFN